MRALALSPFCLWLLAHPAFAQDPAAPPADQPPPKAQPVPLPPPSSPEDSEGPPARPMPRAAESSMTMGAGTVGGADVRSYGADWMILPARSWTFGGNLSFAGAPRNALGMGAGAVEFTDLVTLALSSRISLKGKAELFGGVSLLPKQPAETNESPWAGATLGGRVGLKKRYAAYLELGAGPLLNSDGLWGTAELGIQGRKSIDRTIVFQGAISALGSALRFDNDPGNPTWLTEATAGGEIVLRADHGEVALWVGTDFAFPIVHDDGPLQDILHRDFDPTVRANFHMGFVLSYVENWDIALSYAVIDRGDVNQPETILPFLSGGFDEELLVFGITRRFRMREGQRTNRDLLVI